MRFLKTVRYLLATDLVVIVALGAYGWLAGQQSKWFVVFYGGLFLVIGGLLSVVALSTQLVLRLRHG